MSPALQLSDDRRVPFDGSRSGAPAATATPVTPVEPIHSRNRVLAALATSDPAAFAPLASQLRRRPVAEGELLQQRGGAVVDVWFPETAVVVTRLDGAEGSEIGIVGCEGMIGLPGLLDGGPPVADMVVRVAGTAVRLDAVVLRLALGRSAGLRAALDGYTQALLRRTARATLCNRSHPISQRLALLLLEVHDCVGEDRFPLTHEQLASMLGVRRAGVTEAATRLRGAGAIDYQRGQVVVTDRALLEAKACSCHEANRVG